jgi:hypothetical protein
MRAAGSSVVCDRATAPWQLCRGDPEGEEAAQVAGRRHEIPLAPDLRNASHTATRLTREVAALSQ